MISELASAQMIVERDVPTSKLSDPHLAERAEVCRTEIMATAISGAVLKVVTDPFFSSNNLSHLGVWDVTEQMVALGASDHFAFAINPATFMRQFNGVFNCWKDVVKALEWAAGAHADPRPDHRPPVTVFHTPQSKEAWALRLHGAVGHPAPAAAAQAAAAMQPDVAMQPWAPVDMQAGLGAVELPHIASIAALDAMLAAYGGEATLAAALDTGFGDIDINNIFD
ncbi:hypothetical protein JKP88DRAFT_277329 [Tribonema minus]|uniref:Uncharacterized protein n=1 Tax=Tribonema minus TaxID=303371 RepID=A0A836CFY8_9STRA|nr:hypothetical protein JKP88DRAFT_277329 [Tribonema minus]